MANSDTPFGLRPVRYVSGAPYNGAVNVYSTPSGDATAIYIGDPVKMASTSQTINGRVFADVIQAATGDVITGIVVAVDPSEGAGADGRDSTKYRAASTVRLVYVADDPNLLFEIQEVSGGTALAANDIGLNADFVVGSGSTVTGQSGVELNNSGEADTASLDVKIVGFMNREDNAIGEHAKWLVRLNRHRYVNQVAGT